MKTDPTGLTPYDLAEIERPDPCEHLYDHRSGRGKPRISKVTDNLILGCEEYLYSEDLQRQMRDLGVTHILDCRSKGEIKMRWTFRDFVDPHKSFEVFANPTSDDFSRKSADYFHQAINWALPILDDGGVIYVHCAMGINRGPSNLYAILRAATGMSTIEALTAIRTVRPFAAVAYWRDADDALLVEPR